MVGTMEVFASETMNDGRGSERGDSEWRAGYLGAGGSVALSPETVLNYPHLFSGEGAVSDVPSSDGVSSKEIAAAKNPSMRIFHISVVV